MPIISIFENNYDTYDSSSKAGQIFFSIKFIHFIFRSKLTLKFVCFKFQFVSQLFPTILHFKYYVQIEYFIASIFFTAHVQQGDSTASSIVQGDVDYPIIVTPSLVSSVCQFIKNIVVLAPQDTFTCLKKDNFIQIFTK